MRKAIAMLTLVSALTAVPVAEAHSLSAGRAAVEARAYAAQTAARAESNAIGSTVKVVSDQVSPCRRVTGHAFDCPARYDTTLYYPSGRTGTYACTETIRVRFANARSRSVRALTKGDFQCSEPALS